MPRIPPRRKPAGLARVLVVEDDAVLAMALEDALLAAGVRSVVVCPTMKATLAALAEGPRPDALILDVHLGDRDDGWALAELASLLGPRPPKIVFSTGAPQDIPAQVAGLGPVFVKPYDVAALVSTLVGAAPRGLLARLRRPRA